jgi:putative oxidoreductase
MKEMSAVNTGILFLRCVLGTVFLAHGLQKLIGAFGGGGIEGTAKMMQQMGLVAPMFWAWVVALSETLGGALLILGVFPRISAAVIAVIMIVAILKVHGHNGLFAGQGGFEYPLLIFAVCVGIILAGGGKYSFLNKW